MPAWKLNYITVSKKKCAATMWNNFAYTCIFDVELFPHVLNDRAGPESGVWNIFEFMGWGPAWKPHCNPISYLIRSVNLKWRSNNPVQTRVKAPWWETLLKKQVFFYFFCPVGVFGMFPLCSHVPSACESWRLPACARAADLGWSLAREMGGELARTRRP